MKKGKQPYSPLHKVFSIVAMLLLAWLTVCLPLVAESQKAAKAVVEKASKQTTDDNSNLLGNSNEEKSESGATLLAEYLHELPTIEHHYVLLPRFYKGHPSDLYLAYHPDLIIPPPEA